MLKIKNLRGECQHCGGTIEFHAEHAGSTAECPHCGQTTELMLAVPPEEVSPLTRKTIVFTVLVFLILAAGLIGSAIAFKRAKRLQAERQGVSAVRETSPARQPADPLAAQGFGVSPVTLETAPGSAIVYAVGIVTNVTPRQRFGVKVDLELLSATGEKLGRTGDYQNVLEPNATWKFRALVVEKRTQTARIVAISETP